MQSTTVALLSNSLCLYYEILRQVYASTEFHMNTELHAYSCSEAEGMSQLSDNGPVPGLTQIVSVSEMHVNHHNYMNRL